MDTRCPYKHIHQFVRSLHLRLQIFSNKVANNLTQCESAHIISVYFKDEILNLKNIFRPKSLNENQFLIQKAHRQLFCNKREY